MSPGGTIDIPSSRACRTLTLRTAGIAPGNGITPLAIASKRLSLHIPVSLFRRLL